MTATLTSTHPERQDSFPRRRVPTSEVQGRRDVIEVSGRNLAGEGSPSDAGRLARHLFHENRSQREEIMELTLEIQRLHSRYHNEINNNNHKSTSLSSPSEYLLEHKMLVEYNERLVRDQQAEPFFLVLVDGDSTHFLDEFVKAGAEGGHLAAQKLKQALNTYITTSLGYPPHQKMVIRIYLNMHGLCGAYGSADITKPAVVHEFITAFNRELPLAEFVDVANDKEAADFKIKENFSLFWPNLHCKHIVLAGSVDKGYVSFLRQYSGNADRLTLVEAVPFPRELRELASRFKQTTFNDVFRSEKIPRQLPGGPSTEERRLNYATTTSWRPSTPVDDPTMDRNDNAYMAPRRPMHFNQHGQRVDLPLPGCTNELVKEIKTRRLWQGLLDSHDVAQE